MTEKNPISPEMPANDSSTAKPVKKKHWLLKTVVVLFVLIVGLVLLLPTIVSLGPVRSIVVSQAQGYINGKIEIESYSVGWLSGTSVEGLKIFDNQNQLVLEVNKLDTEASLLKLARGSFDFGKTNIVANATKLMIYPDGHTNLDLLLSKPAPSAPKVPHEPKPASPVSLPNVKVDLNLDLRGSVEAVDASGKTISNLQLRQGSGGTVKIDDINQGINTDLKLIYDVDQRPQSTVQITGDIDAVQNNQLDLANLASKMKVILTSVDIGAAEPMLAIAGVKGVSVDGIATGEIVTDLKQGQAGGATGEIHLTKTRLAMPQIADVYQADLIRLPITVSRVVDGGKSSLKIDIQAVAPEATIAIAGNVPEAAIQNIQQKKMPGEIGTLSILFSAKPEKIAQSLPKTMRLLPDVSITGGDLQSSINVNLKPDRIETITKSSFALQGTKGGKTQSIPPVTIDTTASVADLSSAASGLRDLSAKIVSDFANFNVGGPTIADVSGSGTADLNKLRSQLSQFIDLSQTGLAGQANFNIRNVAREGTKTDYTLTAGGTFTGINVTLPNVAPINLPYVKGDLSSDYVFDPADKNPIKQVKTAAGSLVMGNSPDQSVLDGSIRLADIDLNNLKIGQFTIEKGNITDLAALQKMIDPFVPQLRAQQIQLLGGSIYAAGSGSADLKSKIITLNKLDTSTPNLRVAKSGKELIRDKFVLGAAGKIDASNGLKVDLSTLSVDSAILKLAKTDAPFTADLSGGIPHGSGVVNISSVDLPAVSRIAAALSPQPVNAVTSGVLKGDLNLTSDASNNATVNFSGNIDNLSIDQTPIQNQQVTLIASANAPSTLDRATAMLNVKSAYATVDAKDISINLAKGIAPLKMLEKANLNIGMKDFASAYTLLNALVPSIKLPYTPTSGGVAIIANVSGPTTTVDIKASRLALKNAGGQVYNFNPKQPISIVASLDVKGDQTIDSITVSKLDTDLDIVKVTMNDPIVVTNLSDSPTIKGNITATGTLDRAAPLIQFLQQTDKPLPYRGAFTFKNTLNTSGTTNTLVMDGAIDEFVLLDEQNKPAFSEKQVKIDGNLSVDMKNQTAQIQTLNVNMASSNAAKVNITGGVNQFLTKTIAINSVVAKVDGQGEKVWPIVFPLLPPEQQVKLKDAAITGPVKLNIVAGGNYLTGVPFNESIKQLNVKGDVTLPDADLMKSFGIATNNLRQIFTLKDGRLISGDSDKPKGDPSRFAPPFKVNETGQGDFGSIVINLGDPAMPVTIGRKQVLLKDVKINEVMTSQLGSIASVFFKDSKKATGTLKILQVVRCDNVPLAQLMSGKGDAEFLYSIDDLNLDGEVPSALSKTLGWGKQGIVGNVQNGSLVLKDGVAYQEMTLNLQKMVEGLDPQTRKPAMLAKFEQLQLKGGINLEKGKFEHYSLWIAQGLLPEKWQKGNPNGATVTLSGAVNDINSILVQALGQLAIQGYGGDLIDDLLNKNKKKKEKDQNPFR